MAVRSRPRSYPMRTLLCSLLVVVSLVECAAAYVPLIPPNANGKSKLKQAPPLSPASARKLMETPRARLTALDMGIRSIIGGMRKKNSDAGESEPLKKKKLVPTPVPPPVPAVVEQKVKAKTAAVPKKKDVTSKKTEVKGPSTGIKRSSSVPSNTVRMGEDPNTKEVNVSSLDRQESIQERINRVKSGKMTEEEKEAFLESSLSAGTTLESRKPLRMAVPDTEGGAKRRGLASPFPTDSILRNFARGNATTSPYEDVVEAPVLDSQKKKREYIDMVTNPDRFQPARSSKTGGVTPISGGTSSSDRNTLIPTEAEISSDASDVLDPMPNDLGMRLGAAAIANENLRKQQEAERQKLAMKVEEKRREQQMAAEEIKQKHQDELMRREKEIMERRRQEQESVVRTAEAKKNVEKQRLEELMAAQENYWKNKLNLERGSKQKQEMEADQRAKVEEPSKSYGGPDEHELLDLAEQDREDEWEHNQETIERKAAEITGRAPALNDVQTERGFLEEQARHKTDIDRVRDEQLQRLKELNSPLPAPRTDRPPAVGPILARHPAPAPTHAIPPPRPSSRGLGSSLNSLNNRAAASKQDDAPQNGTVEGAASFDPQSAQRKKTSDQDARLSISELTKKKSSAAKPASSSKSAWSMLTGNNKRTESVPAAPAPAPAPAPKPVAKKVVEPPAPRKGPIRMQIPMGDDDDDSEDEDGVDASSNKSMSIADAMKRSPGSSGVGQGDRSKQWGVDMSRFLD